MKSYILASVFSLVSISSAFAAETPCKREATLAAFRAVLNDKELSLADVTGLAIREAGVSLDKQLGDKVTIVVNLGLTENGLQRPEIVQVELNQTYDNACQVVSTKFQAGY